MYFLLNHNRHDVNVMQSVRCSGWLKSHLGGFLRLCHEGIMFLVVHPSISNRFYGQHEFRWQMFAWVDEVVPINFWVHTLKVKYQRLKFHYFSLFLCNATMYFHETWCIHELPNKDSLESVLRHGVKGQRSKVK